MNDEKTTSSRIEAVENSCRILDLLITQELSGVTELAEKTDLSKTTVHHHLKTLENCGYVRQDDTAYYPSHRILYYGKRIQENNILYMKSKTVLRNLADESNEFAHLVIEENGNSVYINKARGDNAVGRGTKVHIGQRDYLHPSAAGKAILAQMSDQEIRHIVERHGLPQLTNKTINSIDQLFEDIEDIREKGYSLNLEEEVEGINAVGAAIVDKYQQVLGAISISGPKNRLTKDVLIQDYSDLVLNAANVIEVNINLEY